MEPKTNKNPRKTKSKKVKIEPVIFVSEPVKLSIPTVPRPVRFRDRFLNHQLFPGQRAYAEGFGPDSKLANFLNKPIPPKTFGVVSLLVAVYLVVFFCTSVLPSVFHGSRVNQTAIIKSTQTIKTSNIVAGQSIKWTTLVRRSDIKSGQYLLKLPKGAVNIKITSVDAEQASNILSVKPKQQLSLNQRAQLAITIPQLKKTKGVGQFFTASLSNAFKFLTAGLGDAVDNVVQTVAPTADSTIVDLSAQAPAEESAPSESISQTTSPSDESPVVQPTETAPAPTSAPTDYVQVDYETPAPTITSQATDTGELVTVSAPDQGPAVTSTAPALVMVSAAPASAPKVETSAPEIIPETPVPTTDETAPVPQVAPETAPTPVPETPAPTTDETTPAPAETPAPEVVPETPAPAPDVPAESSPEVNNQAALSPVDAAASLMSAFARAFTADVSSAVSSVVAPVLTTINITPLVSNLTVGGATQQLTAETLDQNGNSIGVPITWESSNGAVATVDSNGVVTPVGEGTTDIIASNESVPLTDVLVSTKIPKIFKVGEENKIKIKWKSNGNQDVAFHAYDADNDGYLDYVEWTVPHLSDQVFQIIFESKALQLDADQNVVADVYPQTQFQDGIYASVTDGQYVRVTFDQVLDNTKDTVIYARPTDPNSPAEVQEYPVYFDSDGNATEGPLVATFDSVDHNGSYRVVLTNLQTPTDVFDLKISGNIDIDWIYDVATETAFQIFDDSGAWGSANVYAAKNVNYGVPIGTNFRVRLGIQTANAPPTQSITPILQFKENSGGTWTNITTNSNNVRLCPSESNVDGTTSNGPLWSLTTTYSGGDGRWSSATASNIVMSTFRWREDEYCVYFMPGAKGNTYYFNDYQSGGTVPAIVAAGTGTIYYWVAGGTGNWSDSSNWAATSGGSSGAGVPGSTDSVVFDNHSGSGTATVDSGFGGSVAYLTTGSGASGFTGKILLGEALSVSGDVNLGSGTLDVSSSNYALNVGGNWFDSAGTFTAQGGTVTFNGTATGKNIRTNGHSFGNLTISSSGTVTLSDAMSVSGNLNVSTGTLAVGTQTLAVTGSSTVTSATASALTIGAGATGWTTAGLTIGANGTVTCSGASIITDSGDWDSTSATATFTPSGSTVTLTGTGPNNLTIKTGAYNAGTFNNITINGSYNLAGGAWLIDQTVSGGTLTLGTGATFNINSGITCYLIKSSGGRTVTLNTGSTLSGLGTFTYYADGDVSSKITNNGTISVATFQYTISTATTIPALNYGGSLGLYDSNAAGPFTITLGSGALTVGNNLTISSVGTGVATFDASAYNNAISVAGNWNMGTLGLFKPGTSTVTLNGTAGGKNITLNTANQPTSAFYNLTVNSSNGSGAWTLQDTTSVTGLLTVSAGTLASGAVGVTTGGFTLSGGTLTGSGAWAINGNLTYSSGTNSHTGAWTQGTGNLSWPYSTTANIIKNYSVASGATVVVTGATYLNSLSIPLTSTFSLGSNTVTFYYPTANNFISVAGSLSATSGLVSIILNASRSNTGDIIATGGVAVSADSLATTFTQSGSLQCTSLYVHANTTADVTTIVMSGGGNLGAVTLGNVSAVNKSGAANLTGTYTIASIVQGNASNLQDSINFGTSTVNVTGNINFTGIAVTPGSSTVTLNGTGAQTITSNGQSFATLTVTNYLGSVDFADRLQAATLNDITDASTLKFAAASAGSPHTITSALNITGGASKITLESDATPATTTWYITAPNPTTVTGVSVSYSNSTNPITAMSSTDGTHNNSNWFFEVAPNAPTIVSPLGGTAVNSAGKPTLSVYFSDPNTTDTGTTNYRIATSAGSPTGNDCVNNTNVVAWGSSSPAVANNTNTTWANGSSIGSDATYYWCAQNNDGTLTSAWTYMGSFILDTTNPVPTISSPTSSYYTSSSVPFGATYSDTNAGFLVPNLDSSLVSWWRMDDVDGSGNPTDYMGANNGTKHGTAVQTPNGAFGKAFNFPGTSTDYISGTLPELYRVTKTISAWINTNQLATTQSIFSIGNTATDGAPQTYFVFSRSGASNKLSSYMWNGSSNIFLDSNITLSQNTWYNVVLVFNGTNETIYVNGNPHGTGVGTDPFDKSNNFYIGGGVNGNFNGYIDEVMLFNRALTAYEITALYNATAISHSTTLADGSHTYKTYAEDLAGNVGTSSTNTFTVDTVAPTNSIGAPSASLTNTGPITYAVTYGGADSVSLVSGNVTLNTTGTASGSVAVSGSGTATRTVTISSITGDGTLGISIAAGTASDNAGNTSLAAGPSTTFTVDNTAPINQDTVFASSIPKQGGTAVAIASSGDATNNVWFAPSGTTIFVAGSTMTTAGGTATSIFAPATEGAYRMFVIDAAGNVSSQSIAILTVDNTAPSSVSITTPATGTYKASNLPSLTYNCSDGSGSGCDSSTCQWTVDNWTHAYSCSTWPTNLSDGSNLSLEIRENDLAGNGPTTSSAVTITYDTAAPSSVTSDLTNSNWHNSAFDVTFSCSDSTSGCSKVYYCTSTTNDCTPDTLYVNAAGSWKFNFSTAGDYYLRYKGVDAAGNETSVSTDTYKLKLDTSTPTTDENLNGYTTNTWTNSTVTVDLTCQDTGGSGCSKIYACQDSGSACDPTAGTAYDSPKEFSYATTGTTTLRWKSKDVAGNWQAAEGSVIVKVDKTTPDIGVVDAGASSIDRTSLTSATYFKYSETGSDDQISFSWTDPSSSSDDTFYYELNADSGSTITGNELNTATPYIDEITVSEGTNYFHVRPQNGAGTWGTERIFIVKYDKTLPSVGQTTLSGFATYSTYIRGTGTIVGGAASDVGGSGVNEATCDYTIDNGSNWLSGSWNTDHCEETSVSISNGITYTFNTRVKDVAVNQGTGTATGAYTGDTAGPTSPSITITDISGYTNDNTPTLTLSAVDSSSGLKEMALSCNNSTWGGWITYATSYSSFNIETGAGCSVGNGAKIVYAKFRDNLDNESSSANDSTTFDTATPTQSAWSPASTSTITTATPTITLTLNENGDCKSSVTDQAYADMTTDCTGDGTTSISCVTSSLAPDGAKDVYVACKDTAGNEDTIASNTKLSYILDTTPPTTSNYSPSNGSTIADATPEITFSTNELGDCLISETNYSYDDMASRVAGGGAVDCVESGLNHTCQMTSLLPDGAKTIYIACEDYPMGNKDTTGTTDHVSYILDTTPSTVVFSNDVALGPVQTDTIIGDWGDAAVKKWDYKATSGACLTTASFTKTDLDSMYQDTQTNNGKWICLYAEDAVGNKSVKASANFINIDATSPTVSGVTSSLDNGSYTINQVVPIQVSFTEPVTVSGTPKLTLSTGTPSTTAVNYTSGSGTATLTFNYTVSAGNTSADLDYALTTSLALNGGTIKDAVGNNAVLTLVNPGDDGSLGFAKALVIDTTSPTLSFINPVAVGPGVSDIITANWGGASIMKWDYSYTTSCPSTAGSYNFTSLDSISQSTEDNNTKYICLYGEDVAGNSATLASDNVIYIDATPPVTASSGGSYTLSSGNWSTADVTITLTCGDAGGSGCLSTLYCTDIYDTCTPDQAYNSTSKPVISTQGLSYIRYYSVDALLNSELATVKSASIKVDTGLPTTTDDFANNGIWEPTAQTITLTPADVTSLVVWTKYCTDTDVNNPCDPATGTDYNDTPVVISTEGTSYFRYTSEDNAGNTQATQSKTVMIDTTAQVTQVAIAAIANQAPGVVIPNVIITNEGHFNYEYRYDYCVQNATNFDPNSACTSGDVYPITTNSKLINAGDSFSPTTISVTVSTAGSYYFKVITHYGTGYSQSSSASQPFTVSAAVTPPSGGGGGGGGIIISPIIPTPAKCSGKADLNHDCKVNLVDFSILAYWYNRPNPPSSVDLNGDGKINLVDFSIMAYYWTK